MLNQEKVFKALQQYTQPFFAAYTQEQQKAYMLLERVAEDPFLASKVAAFSSCFAQTGLPSWSGALSCVYDVADQKNSYEICAVDGSQIYPDRHQGIDCYLINIGIVHFIYNARSYVDFYSDPYLFFHDAADMNSFEATPELISCQRTEYELQAMLHKNVCSGTWMLDGSLIFWHLGSKESIEKNRFFKKYIEILQRVYDRRILHAGYISLPKSRELIHILQAVAMLPEHKEFGEHFAGRCLVDADILGLFLRPGQRTTIFENHAPIVTLYPDSLRPCFFYIHTGTEIARIEIPAWIACQQILIDQLASIILDQAGKGNGYPVCLAEAHEQAVVKSSDRELFYMLLQKVMQDKKISYTFSQKSMHKRILGI
jgi:hypothetical protein